MFIRFIVLQRAVYRCFLYIWRTCKDNTDKEFADCSIPQEKSNSDINEELEISDEDGDTMPKYNKNKSTGSLIAIALLSFWVWLHL